VTVTRQLNIGGLCANCDWLFVLCCVCQIHIMAGEKLKEIKILKHAPSVYP